MIARHLGAAALAVCLSSAQSANAGPIEDLLGAISAKDMAALERVLISDPSSAELTVRARSSNALRVAPIHSAMARGDLAMLQTLLLRGADPDQTQQRLMRPIHEAAAAGAMPIVAMLLMFGADASARSEDGRSAADFATANGHVDLARRLEAVASGPGRVH